MSRKLKIALICENYPPDSGGIAVSARRLAFSLSSLFEIHIICFPRGNPDCPPTYKIKKESNTLFIHEIRPFVNGWEIPSNTELRAKILYQASNQVTSILRERQINIIQGFGLQNAGLVAARAGYLLGLPLIQSVRGNDVGRNVFDGVRRKPLELALRNAKKIIAVNHWLADLLKDNFPNLKNRISIISNGIEIAPKLDNHLKNKQRALLQIPPDVPIIGFVGTLREKKGPYLFSKIINYFLRKYNGRLLIIGDINLDLFYDSGWNADKFDKNFLIIKKAQNRLELYSLINLCDWCVFPSLDDGMANGVLETMACSKPIIASPIFSNVAIDNCDGFIIPPLDYFDYVSACEKLWKNPIIRKKFGDSAKQHVMKNFSIKRERESWISLYNQLSK